MACREKEQSAIQEVRDQLFLDTADDVRLNVVTSNLGLDRPLAGIDDDEWRALAKSVMLDFKQVRNVFFKLLEVCLGPQHTRTAFLAEDAAISDPYIQVLSSQDLVQVGRIVIDPGLASEETVDFCYRDLVNGKVFLSTTLTKAHPVVVEVSSYVVNNTPAGSHTLVLKSTDAFPTSGQFAIIVDKGLSTEELLVVSGNNTSTDTLTLIGNTTQAHTGPTPKDFLVRPLFVSVAAGATFFQFDEDATRSFPNTGFVRINTGGGTAEVVEFTANDVVNNVLTLRTPLAHAHVGGGTTPEYVELVTPGAVVSTVQVVQFGVPWELYETEPQKVKICFDQNTVSLRLTDASFLHAASPSAFNTTLTAPVSAVDTVLHVVTTSGLRYPTGAILVAGTTYLQYSAFNATSITLTYAAGTTFNIGDVVLAASQNYSGTDLEEGNLRTSSGDVNPRPEWSGPYLYDEFRNAPSLLRTTFSRIGSNPVAIPNPTSVAFTQTLGCTCLEVRNAFDWPTPVAPYVVRIGRDTGYQEDNHLTAIHLARNGKTTLSVGALIGDTTLTCMDTTGLPVSSDGSHPARYRIVVSRGLPQEEVLFVDQNNNMAPGTLTLQFAVTAPHSIGATVELLNDVMTFDTLTLTHFGDRYTPTRVGHPVEILVTQLVVNPGSATVFPSSGTLWLNFGANRLTIRRRITGIPSSSQLTFADSSDFPLSFPYPILIGQGLPTQEWALVSANNTVTDTLTLTAPMAGTFSVGDYIEFYAGVPTTVDYKSRDAGTFTLDEPSVFLNGYTVGESVIWSPGSSVPSADGFDYPLRMPPSPVSCVASLVDLVRAAGVEVQLLKTCLRP